MKLKDAFLLNVKSLSELSPGGIELSWLTHLVSTTIGETSQEKVKEAADFLVNERKLQQPFKGIYLPKGKEVLIARN